MALVMEEDETFDPIHVGIFGAVGVMLGLEGVMHLVEQFFALRQGGGGIRSCHFVF